MLNYIYRSYKIIDEVLRKDAFSSIELSHALNVAAKEDRAKITKIVYGVLENSVKYDYIISTLCDKKPKKSVLTLLKTGMFLLYEMDSVPTYTAVSECAKIASKISKGSLTGFVNGFLRRASEYVLELPKDVENRLSVQYSTPKFIVNKLADEYGFDLAEQMLQKPEILGESVRINGKYITAQEFENTLNSNKIAFKKQTENSYLVKAVQLKELFFASQYTVQALASILDVDVLNPKENDEILDVCSAPGGKAVYAAEKAKSVVACDIHEHRVALIDSYARRMGAENVLSKLMDGTVFEPSFSQKFDKIICDVPCSGSGVMHERPDVLFGITEEKIKELCNLQLAILTNCSKYLKSNGTMVYSTCSLFKEENDFVVGEFLKENGDFCVEEFELPVYCEQKMHGKQLLPNKSQTIGFYISKLRRK